MLLQIGSYILIIGIAFYQVTQGLFSALVMAICSIFSALIALNFYEPLADLFAEFMPAQAEAGALALLLIASLIVLRLAADKLLRNNVVFGMWADRIGGGALGLISGLTVVGVLMIVLQMLPWGYGVLGFQPYDEKLQPADSSLPANFVLGLFSQVSGGSLAGQHSFEEVHPNLQLELAAARNQIGVHSRTNTPADAFKVVNAYWMSPSAQGGLDTLPPSATRDEKAHALRPLLIETIVAESARENWEEADKWYRLPATHFQLTTANGTIHYPVAYMTYYQTSAKPNDLKNYGRWREVIERQQGSWKAITPPYRETGDDRPLYARLAVQRRWWSEGGPKQLRIYWVYALPPGDEFNPAYLTFRRSAVQEVPAPSSAANLGVLKTQDALGRIIERDR
ncbi:MAG: CvpA family protein [Phycisphaerae bacterium]